MISMQEEIALTCMEQEEQPQSNISNTFKAHQNFEKALLLLIYTITPFRWILTLC